MNELELAFISIDTLRARVQNLEIENAHLKQQLYEQRKAQSVFNSQDFSDEENTGSKWGGNGH